MQWTNTNSRYGLIASALHWMIVAGIIGQYILAEAGEDRQGASASAFTALNAHTSMGVLILALALIRLVWRWIDPPPAWPVTMRRYEIGLARTVHWTFYALLFAIPITGWALATVDAQPATFFGLFQLPQLRIGAQWPIAGGTLNEAQLEEAHEILFNLLMVLAILHIIAALLHQFVKRDNILRRMLSA